MPQVDIGLVITAVNNAAAGLKNVGDGVKKIGENAQATENRLKAIQVVIAGIAIEKIRQLGDAFLRAAAATQSLDLHLAAFAGGVGPASAIWNKLNTEFGATPFKIDQITTSWIKLQAVTGNSAESTKIIEAVVNAVAAMPDGSDAKINDVTSALQRMLATGTVEGRQFKSLITDVGLTVGDLAKAAGKGTAEFTRALNDGFVNSQTMIDAFIKASNDKFGDFAIKLGSTLGGAMNKIENDFSGALSRLGERTDINDRLTQVFQNLDTAVMSFIDHINQGDIDAFFNILSNMEPIVVALLTDIKNLAGAFLGVTNAAAVFLDLLPAEATEYGIIGYVIWGKKGAIIGIALGLVDKAVRVVMNSVVQGLNAVGAVSNQFAASFAKEMAVDTLTAITRDLSGLAGIGGQTSGIFAKSAAATEKIKKDLAGITGVKPNVVPVTGDTDKYTRALEAAARAGDALEAALTKAIDDVNGLNAATSGDELGAHIEDINKKTDGWIAALQTAIDKESALEVHTQANKNLVAALKQEQDLANDARDRAIAKEKELFTIKTQSFLLEQRIAQFGIADQFAKLQQQSNTSSGFNLLGGTAGGSAHLQLMQTEFDLRTQILQISKEQNDIDAQIAELGGPNGPNAERVAALEKTRDVYRQLGDLANQSLKDLTIEGTLSKQMWTDIGNSLHNDVADGIKGVISGTETLGEVARKVWSDITDAVIQYLLKLAEAKAMGQSMNAVSGSGGGFSIGSLLGLGGGGDGLSTIAVTPQVFGSGVGSAAASSGFFESIMSALAFSKGGALTGHITPFANGGLTTGPTLFGMMGEAGTEAVMPLTRIGGKLGVHASGGGSNHYHISLNAIDTQTGLEFLEKHIASIDGQLGQRKTLHRNVRLDQ